MKKRMLQYPGYNVYKENIKELFDTVSVIWKDYLRGVVTMWELPNIIVDEEHYTCRQFIEMFSNCKERHF